MSIVPGKRVHCRKHATPSPISRVGVSVSSLRTPLPPKLAVCPCTAGVLPLFLTWQAVASSRPPLGRKLRQPAAEGLSVLRCHPRHRLWVSVNVVPPQRMECHASSLRTQHHPCRLLCRKSRTVIRPEPPVHGVRDLGREQEELLGYHHLTPRFPVVRDRGKQMDVAEVPVVPYLPVRLIHAGPNHRPARRDSNKNHPHAVHDAIATPAAREEDEHDASSHADTCPRASCSLPTSASRLRGVADRGK